MLGSTVQLSKELRKIGSHWQPPRYVVRADPRSDPPRSARAVRHPLAGMVVLMLLGMLARIREMEVSVRWATIRWDRRREPLGIDRDEPPFATTISRTLAKCRVADFQAAV